MHRRLQNASYDLVHDCSKAKCLSLHSFVRHGHIGHLVEACGVCRSKPHVVHAQAQTDGP